MPDPQEDQFLDRTEDTPTGGGAGLYGEEPPRQVAQTPNRLNDQGYGAVGLSLSAPRPPQAPQVESGPFTQADKIRMARLQAGLASAEEQYSNGRITGGLLSHYRQRINRVLQPLTQKQKQFQQQQQQEMMQAAQQQAAMQEAIQGIHGQRRAQNFPQTVGSFTDPNNGRVSHFAPKMTQHGTHWDPMDDGQNDPETGRGVEDFGTLLQRAQQQIPQPQGQPMMMFHGRLVQNRAFTQWHAQTNQLAQKWMQNQQREQQQKQKPSPELTPESLQQQMIQHPQLPGVWLGRDHNGKLYKVHDEREAQHKLGQQKLDMAQAESTRKASERDAKNAEHGEFLKQWNQMIGDITTRLTTKGTPGVGDKPGTADKLPSEEDVVNHITKFYPHMWDRWGEYESERQAMRKSKVKHPAAPDTGDGGEMGKAHEDYQPVDKDKAAIDAGLGA